jgi:fibronectin type 3 domain-containing protein
MADHLRLILEGADLGTVTVTTRDRFAGGSSYCNNLASWFYWPFGEWAGFDPEQGWYNTVEGTDIQRWADLRSDNGTEFDFVVLIGDPYTIESTPGYYTLGVAKIAEEVAKGNRETVLLMPWPAPESSSTLDHYREVVYRTGRTAGIPVAPAGLAWQAAGSPTGLPQETTHPSAEGAYIAAATLYSRLFGESASTSTYRNGDATADSVHATVAANQGAPQYSGPFEFNNPFKMLGDKRRHLLNSNRGSSTENRIRRHLNDDTLPELKVTRDWTRESYNSNTPDDDGLGWPQDWPLPTAFNWGRHRASAGDGSLKSYFTNRDYWQLGFGFAYQATSDPNTYTSQMSSRELSLAYLMKEGTTSYTSYNLSAYDQQEEIATARLIPLHTLWAMIHREFPDETNMADQSHINRALGKSGATFMYTTYSGRTPVQDAAQASSYVENAALNHYAQRVGYETAWILGRVQARAPGFKVTPATDDPSVASETMSVRFLFPPQAAVTVNVSVSDPSLAEVSQDTIVFTQENYADPVEINVRALARQDGSDQSYAVQFSTSSDDEVFDDLSDSWSFEMPANAAPGIAITSPTPGATLPAFTDLAVSVDASDPDGSVQSVSLWLNGSLVREDSSAPYEWSVGAGDSELGNLPDDLYEIEVVAVDNQGESYSVSRILTVGSPGTVPPAAPQGLRAAIDFGTTTSSVRLEWEDNSEGDFQSYSVFRRTSAGIYDKALANELSTSSYTDSEVENGTVYFYVVIAVDLFGNQSSWSTEISATPQLGPGLTLFGSENDGFGGFATSAETDGQVWSQTASSVHYAFDTISGSTASLLKSYALDRSDGSTYTIEGVVDLTDGYGDDNNRIGILLFNATATQTSDGGGGLYLRLNTDGADLSIKNGINGSTTLANTSATGTYSEDSWIGTTITFKADITFTGSDIEVDFTFTDQDGVEDVLSATVPAADYTGTYFGFASKWRNRGSSSSNRDVPPDFDYRSFLLIDTLPPSAPTGLSALAGDGFITLDWDDNAESDLSGYAVWRGTASGDYEATPLAEDLSTSQFTDTNLISGTTYFYAITARDLSSNKSSFSDELSRLYLAEDSELDSDGDGMSDADELLAGSDPNDASSRFRLISVSPQNGGAIAFEVSVNPSSYYRVYYRDSLNSGSWQPLSGYENVSGVASPMRVEDSTTADARFYKVAVQSQPW